MPYCPAVDAAFADSKHQRRGATDAINHEANWDPCRHEAIYLDEDEQKVVSKPDTRLPHHTVFTFHKEDHTLGNLLTERLNSMPHVIFAAYKVPHPLFPQFELRIGTDGEITPKEALKESCRGSVQDLQTLSNEFVKEWALSEARRMAEGNEATVPY